MFHQGGLLLPVEGLDRGKRTPPRDVGYLVPSQVAPDIAVLKNSPSLTQTWGDVQKLRCMFWYGNNRLLGMREDETFVVIGVFDRVGFPVQHLALSLDSDLF